MRIKPSAFSLIEMSIVIMVVGLLIAGVAQTSKMIKKSSLTAAQSQTKQSVVKDMPGLALWYESTLDNSFVAEERVDGAGINAWYDNNPQALSKSNAGLMSSGVLYEDDAINGLPSLKCTGSGGIQVSSSTEYFPANTPYVVNSFTIFLVAKATTTHQIDTETNSTTDGTSGQTYPLGAKHSGGYADNGLNTGAGISLGTNGVSVYEHGGSYMPAISVYDGTSSKVLERPVIITVDYNNKTPTIFINSNISHAGLTSPRSVVIAPYTICTGDYGAFIGFIGEVIIFNRHLLTDERKAVEKYLSKKWKIDFS